MQLILLLLSSIIISCSTTEKWETAPNDLTLMTYNVENLFDAVHDPGKNDIAYLPRSYKDAHPQLKAQCAAIKVRAWRNQCLYKDWTDKAIAKKMKRLADVIMRVKNGNGPDILLLQEIENMRVLERLRTKFLTAGHYKHSILIEGPDHRGVDTAIITRLKTVGEPKLHILNFKPLGALKNRPQKPTRGILEVTLELPNKELLTVFSVHFPSQGGPTELRRQAVEKLAQLKATLPANRKVVIGGDFNITAEEDAKYNLLNRYLSKDFYISHHIGLFNEKGTEVYRGHWSFLDIILFSKNMNPEGETSGFVFRPESLRIIKDSIYQVSRFYTPNRFNKNNPGGVSDHYPVAVDLTLKQ